MALHGVCVCVIISNNNNNKKKLIGNGSWISRKRSSFATQTAVATN